MLPHLSVHLSGTSTVHDIVTMHRGCGLKACVSWCVPCESCVSPLTADVLVATSVRLTL